MKLLLLVKEWQSKIFKVLGSTWIFFVKVVLKRYKRNLTITFTYTLDKPLKVKPLCFSCTIPLCWLFYNAFVYIFIQINQKPGNGISFCMIFSLVFFVCYVSDKVVSFSDSAPMRNIAQCKHFLQNIFCWFVTKKLYDSVIQKALIKLLADQYSVDYNVQQDFSLNSLLEFHTSTSQHQKSKT